MKSNESNVHRIGGKVISTRIKITAMLQQLNHFRFPVSTQHLAISPDMTSANSPMLNTNLPGQS